MSRATQPKDGGEGVIPVLAIGNDISVIIEDENVHETLVLNTGVETIIRINSSFAIMVKTGELNPNVSPAPTRDIGLKISADQPEYFNVPAGEALAVITEDGLTFGTINITKMR